MSDFKISEVEWVWIASDPGCGHGRSVVDLTSFAFAPLTHLGNHQFLASWFKRLFYRCRSEQTKKQVVNSVYFFKIT